MADFYQMLLFELVEIKSNEAPPFLLSDSSDSASLPAMVESRFLSGTYVVKCVKIHLVPIEISKYRPTITFMGWLSLLKLLDWDITFHF